MRVIKALTAAVVISIIGLGLTVNSGGNQNTFLINPALTLIKASFPELWLAIGNSTPTVKPANPAEVGEALSGFETYIIKWYSGGVSVKVVESVIDGSPTPVRLEVMVNGYASKKASMIVKHGSKILGEMRDLYKALINEALSNAGVKVIGFQIIINNTPTGFIDVSKPAIIPAQILWREYFVKPVLAFTVINDYPIVKAAIRNSLTHKGKLNFKVSEEELRSILSKHLNLSEVTDVMKYYVIANKTARPAYLITLGPWNNAVVLADTGEYLPKPTKTTSAQLTTQRLAENVTAGQSASKEWNYPIPRKYFPYFLSGLSMTLTAIIGWLLIRRKLREAK